MCNDYLHMALSGFVKIAHSSFAEVFSRGEAVSLASHSLQELVQVVVLHAKRFTEAPLHGKFLPYVSPWS